MTKKSSLYTRIYDEAKEIKYILNDKNLKLFLEFMDNIEYSPSNVILNEQFLSNLNDISPNNKEKLVNILCKLTNMDEVLAVCSTLYSISKVDNKTIDLCWTGPRTNLNIRYTWPFLSQMIIKAKKNIIIVGYSINTGLGEVLNYLKDKSKDGVILTFMVDKLDDKKDFLRWIESLTITPELYDRPLDNNDPMSKLHIKCVVIDNEIAMIGSSNFTYHGMKENIELGIIVYDKEQVIKIIQLLDELKKHLVKYDLNNHFD